MLELAKSFNSLTPFLSVADKIDLLYESFGEIQKRNPEPLFFEIYESSLETIMQFDHLSSVQDFIQNIIPEMLRPRYNNQRLD